MSKERVIIFDTTLRDGEQAPGATMNLEEKLLIAKTLEKMGVDNAEERADSFGKDKKLEKKKKKGAFIRQRLTEKDKIEEAEKKIMSKMVEDIVLNKKNKSKEINKKEEKPTTKLIMKNLESLKKLAEKEGINLSDLIQDLKK